MRRSKLLYRGAWIVPLAMLAGAVAIIRVDIAQRREDLYTQARTAHRLLSQATSRVDAVLETLVLTAVPGGPGTVAAEATTRLPSVYPQVVAAWRRDAMNAWPEEAGGQTLDAIAPGTRLRPAGSARPAVASVDARSAQYTVVLDGKPASFALRIDARRLVLQEEWPWPDTSQVRATLGWRDQVLVLHEGPPVERRPSGMTDGFEFSKQLASDSQPFVLRVQRHTGPAEWPWLALGLWAALCLASSWVLHRWLADRAARLRAAEQVRLARASRLGVMGELAAGIAHELNQPLTAVLASTQTALRTLRELGLDRLPSADEGSLSTIDRSLELSAAQARRASDVVARMRRLVHDHGAAAAPAAVDIGSMARRLVETMAEELRGDRIDVAIEGHAGPALADATGVEQILHNLLTNAAQALREAPRGVGRRIVVSLSMGSGRVRCAVADNGPGVLPSDADRLFEPFFTTRPDGMGLGLPLCQTLATALGGSIAFRQNMPAGAVFELDLPAKTTDIPSA